MKYVQTCERSNEWPQADLHWPLMTSKLWHIFISKKVSSWDIICNKIFAVLDHMTSHDPELTSYELNWPSLKISSIIAIRIGMLHIKWMLKTAVLQNMLVLGQQAVYQNNLSTSGHHILLFRIIWPLMTLNWPLMNLIDLESLEVLAL